ncbi:hypothetical protein QBC38DRAFT_458273 [Podospora fimiseda]|uniref:Uncharacterized protein n=1 Tax=Podospora fimiseda TaxID=252190 RepID=A0AAN7BJA5_9PEZI|nr:hypothetical protein QBC38DRAFT_458273 [Podospora fimiseda]
MKVSALLVAAVTLLGSTEAYRLSVYSKDNYQGTQKTYTTKGSRSVGFTVKSWIWTSTPGDGCCVNFCKGSTSMGRFCGSARKEVSSAGVNKVVTGCGNDVLNC